jgi:capsular polysaccharide biosynthesis protein
VQVATLRTRVAEFSARVAQARESMKTAPQLEAEAAQLNRDYEITKKNYDNLVARRQAAVMSGDLESASGVADFRLIDPPRVSPQPVSPNRLLLLPLVLVAAIGAGLFTAFAASQLRPTFHDAYDLRQKTGLPLLGVVSAVLSDVDKRRERIDRLRFFGASGGLVLLFAAGLALMAVMAAR